MGPVDRAVKFCFVSFVVLAMMTSQVGATNTQGFYRGLKSGDRLDYVFVVHGSSSYGIPSLNERVYIIVNGMPPLPDIVTMASEVMSFNTTAYWANGSAMAVGGVIGLSFLIFVAVGNWPLLSDLMFVGLPSEYEMVDDSSVWGIRGGSTMGTLQTNVSLLFSKSDGATFQYYVLMRDLATDAEVLHTGVNRLSVGVSTPVLLSAAIISAEIIVAVLIIRRYRH